MKRFKGNKTVTYEADYGFMVDIVDTVDDRNGCAYWDVWLYRKHFGYKMSMFGLMKTDHPTIKSILSIIEANLPDYYPDYDEQFCQHDDVDRSYEDDYEYEDCDDGAICCPVCGSDDVEVIQYKETEDDVKKAEELKGQYAQFVRDHLVTERFGERVDEFIDYKINNCGTGWWVGLNDAGMLFDMTIIAQDFAGWVHMDD